MVRQSAILKICKNLITNEMKIDFNVIGLSMKKRIVCKRCGKKIITPSDKGERKRYTKLTKQGTKPNDLTSHVRESLILEFSVRPMNLRSSGEATQSASEKPVRERHRVVWMWNSRVRVPCRSLRTGLRVCQ